MKNVDDGMTPAETTALVELCQAFVRDKSINCPETIYQCDRVIEAAYELMEKICNTVGYFRDPDDAEDVE